MVKRLLVRMVQMEESKENHDHRVDQALHQIVALHCQQNQQKSTWYAILFNLRPKSVSFLNSFQNFSLLLNHFVLIVVMHLNACIKAFHAFNN